MTLIKDLMGRHAALLTPEQEQLGLEMLRRADARRSFAFPDGVSRLAAQTGFIHIEREFSDAPVHLFGQDVPSLAHSRISILRSEEQDDGSFEPGAPIFSARISEKALTEAVLLSNRGEGQPMTVTRLGEFDLPPRGRIASKAERSRDSYSARNEARVTSSIEGFRGLLSPDLKRSNADLRAAASDLSYAARDLVSTSFSMQRHLEEMTILRSEVLTEAAHAALHADKVKAALAGGLTALPAPEPIDWTEVSSAHPMVDATLDPLPAIWREALRTMIVAEVERLAEDHPKLLGWIGADEGGTIVSFPSPQGMSMALGWETRESGVREHVDRLASLWNWAFNPHIAEARERYAADQATMAVTQRSGWMGNIHSSLPPTEGNYFSLRFCTAWQDQELGSTRVRSRSMPLVEIELVAEDLMTALRGHPEGLPVPCSIRGMAGIHGTPVDRPQHQLAADIEAIDKEIGESPEVVELQKALHHLDALASSKRTGKAWREELEAGLARVEAAFVSARRRVDAGTVEGRQQIDAHVAESARQILGSIARSLPADALDILRLTHNE